MIKVVDDDLVTFLGLGFADRGDSYDLNSKLRHHFNSVKVMVILYSQGSSKLDLDLCARRLIPMTNLVKVSDSDYDVNKIANERPVYTVIDHWS